MGIFSISAVLGDVTAEIIADSRQNKKIARDEKKVLLEKLENSTGENIFKYMNLIAFASMDEFVADSRLQAQQSFKMCIISAVVGFAIICASVAFAFYFQFAGIERMTSSYLGAGVGLITEAIAAIFFALYARATAQMNRVHDHLLASQSTYAAILSSALIPEGNERQQQIVELSRQMVSRSLVNGKSLELAVQ